ncbi:MAG TPA: phosphosulfolactate synthase [Candidatus Nitrosocosmicus sp.]
MLDNLAENIVDYKKPRPEGITYIIDKFQGFDKENFELIADFIDMVKIYGAYPLLISEDNLIRRIDFYHKKIVLVSTRSTLTEYALRENVFEKFVEESKTAGFDIIKISENNVNIYSEEKKKLVKVLDYHNLKLNLKIGKKDPRRQLSLDDTIKKINEP